MRLLGWLLVAVLSVDFAGVTWAWEVRSKDAKGGQQYVLLQDGTISKREQHGDPKTGYDRSENRLHSAVQRARTGESGGTPVEQPPATLLDISTWLLNGQGGGGATDWHVEYLSTAAPAGTIDRVTVIYDLTTGTATGAYRETMTATGADYIRTDLDPSQVTVAPYCTGTYGCIP